jgi:isochorismate synthase
MIDWPSGAAELARLATQALPGRLLSVGLPLPHWPRQIRWLDSSVAWQRPMQDVQLLGCGVACVTTSIGTGRFAALHAAHRGLLQSWLCSDDAKPVAFTGFAFTPNGGDPLPNARLWVPELLLRAEHGQLSLTCSTPAQHAATAIERWREKWHAWNQPAILATPTISLNRNPLADQAFQSRGRAALRAIASGELDKLVLTRSIELSAAAAIPPPPLLAKLAERHPNCATFGVAFGGRAFVGVSPETLLSLSGLEVCVDALAGTAWQTATRALGDDKNRREHDFVARAIAQGLTDLCDDIVLPDAPEVMHLKGLTHLRRRICARRNAEVSAYDLIARLHPTPAVGGTPTLAALDWLKRHGDRRDAWYTGGIGWLDAHGNADIAVALRCGLIETNSIALYAGAGFVAGSEPEQELAETEAKLATLRDVLMADSAAARIAA